MERCFELLPAAAVKCTTWGPGVGKDAVDTFKRVRGAPDGDEKVRQLLLEIVWLVVERQLDVGQLCACLKEMGTGDEGISEQLAYVLWFVGMEVRSNESEEEKELSENWKHLCELVKVAVGEGVVDKRLLMEVLELDMLSGAGIGDRKVFTKQLVKANTNKLYRQRKYNLVSEESEGYAKLVTELTTLTERNVAFVIENMQKLIGYFRLDPNRVFDLVLDAYENDPQNTCYGSIVDLFRSSNLKQILGFKFQMYHPPDEGEDENDGKKPSVTKKDEHKIKATPLSLFTLTAYLIEQGRLEIDDILPHLYPSDSVLTKYVIQRERKIIQASRKIGVVRLKSRSAEQIKKERAEEEEATAAYERQIWKEDTTNQKFGLVAGMLTNGDWEGALKLATKFGKSGAFDHVQVLSVLFQQLGVAIDPLYTSLSGASVLSAARNDPETVDCVAVLGEKVPREMLGQGVFTPVKSTLELLTKFSPVIQNIGHRLHKDVPLMYKIVRVLNKSIDTIMADLPAKKSLMLMIADTLLTSLSSIETPNPGFVLELWDLISKFSFQVRYDLYERWRSDQYERVASLVMVRAKTVYASKQVLKRVANERDAMKLVCRRLGKISHNNPVVVLSSLLDNVQSYDNLIPITVDSLRYLTPLSFDILAYLLIVYLGKDEQSKIKDDGQSHSHWLQSLCKFAGYFYLKYPTVELSGLIHFVIRQLKLNRSLDLLILDEIIARMSGLDIIQDFSPETLLAMAGGEVLRGQARASMGAATVAKKKPIKRLRDTLEGEGLLMPLLILIAQQQQWVLFDKAKKNLKLIGHNYDESSSVLLQFMEFVSALIPVQEFSSNHLVSLLDLTKKYHVEPAVAFHIARPVIAAANHKTFFADSKNFASSLQDPKRLIDDERAKKWAVESDEMKEMATFVIESKGKYQSLSPSLFTIFWSLSLYDILVPRSRYDVEIDRVRQALATMKSGGGDQALSDKKRQQEVARLGGVEKNLVAELDMQTENRTYVIKLFDKHKPEWLLRDEKNNIQGLNATLEFLQLCFLPRLLFSPQDALYCARFAKLMHDRSVPGFSTLFFYDKAIQYAGANIHCVTEHEAGNLGIFLKDVFVTLAGWTKDKKTYLKEVEARPGAVKNFKEPKSAKINFVEFKKCVAAWHKRLGTIFQSSFSSDSYMRIRPALIVTSKMIDCFPLSMSIAVALKEKATKLAGKDERQDIKTMAKRYEAMLDKKIRSGKLIDDVPKPAVVKKAEPKKEVHKPDPMDVDTSGTSKKRGREENEKEPAAPTKRPKSTKDDTPSQAGTETKTEDKSTKPENKGGDKSKPSDKPKAGNDGKKEQHSSAKTNSNDRGGKGAHQDKGGKGGNSAKPNSNDRGGGKGGGHQDKGGNSRKQDSKNTSRNQSSHNKQDSSKTGAGASSSQNSSRTQPTQGRTNASNTSRDIRGGHSSRGGSDSRRGPPPRDSRDSRGGDPRDNRGGDRRDDRPRNSGGGYNNRRRPPAGRR
mmetsp:Transcript_11861/g.21788  ORF Transcript_11861/g.21788 Transcript_11861/m.21788 type:complete len:1487 (+) Transcript_11861:406-4866(+)